MRKLLLILVITVFLINIYCSKNPSDPKDSKQGLLVKEVTFSGWKNSVQILPIASPTLKPRTDFLLGSQRQENSTCYNMLIMYYKVKYM